MSKHSYSLSRRALVTIAAAAIPSTVIATTAPAAIGHSADDARINELWAERTTNAAELRKLDREIEEAQSKMPDWAQPGPRYLHSDGSYDGEVVGWPLIEGGRTPEGSAMMNKRPSPDDIRKNFEWHVRYQGRQVRKQAQKVYEESMALMNERLRLQTIEKQKVGLPGLLERQEMLLVRNGDIDDAVGSVPLSPMRAAAMFMISMLWEGGNESTLEEGDGLSNVAPHVLPLLRPQLTGLIRSHVDDLIDNPSKPNFERAWW